MGACTSKYPRSGRGKDVEFLGVEGAGFPSAGSSISLLRNSQSSGSPISKASGRFPFAKLAPDHGKRSSLDGLDGDSGRALLSKSIDGPARVVIPMSPGSEVVALGEPPPSSSAQPSSGMSSSPTIPMPRLQDGFDTSLVEEVVVRRKVSRGPDMRLNEDPRSYQAARVPPHEELREVRYMLDTTESSASPSEGASGGQQSVSGGSGCGGVGRPHRPFVPTQQAVALHNHCNRISHKSYPDGSVGGRTGGETSDGSHFVGSRGVVCSEATLPNNSPVTGVSSSISKAVGTAETAGGAYGTETEVGSSAEDSAREGSARPSPVVCVASWQRISRPADTAPRSFDETAARSSPGLMCTAGPGTPNRSAPALPPRSGGCVETPRRLFPAGGGGPRLHHRSERAITLGGGRRRPHLQGLNAQLLESLCGGRAESSIGWSTPRVRATQSPSEAHRSLSRLDCLGVVSVASWSVDGDADLDRESLRSFDLLQHPVESVGERVTPAPRPPLTPPRLGGRGRSGSGFHPWRDGSGEATATLAASRRMTSSYGVLPEGFAAYGSTSILPSRVQCSSSSHDFTGVEDVNTSVGLSMAGNRRFQRLAPNSFEARLTPQRLFRVTHDEIMTASEDVLPASATQLGSFNVNLSTPSAAISIGPGAGVGGLLSSLGNPSDPLAANSRNTLPLPDPRTRYGGGVGGVDSMPEHVGSECKDAELAPAVSITSPTSTSTTARAPRADTFRPEASVCGEEESCPMGLL